MLRRGYYEGAPARIKSVGEPRGHEELAVKLQELRAAAELTQAALARLAGTAAPAICRLENPTYEGHSVALLRRIAAALGHRVEIRFIPAGRLLD